jgi:hypothetical protein
VAEKVVRDEYEDVPDTLREDIAEFVEELAKGGFVGFEA